MNHTVAEHLVRYLERRGVRHVFGLCGHTNIAVLSAMANKRNLSSSAPVDFQQTEGESNAKVIPIRKVA